MRWAARSADKTVALRAYQMAVPWVLMWGIHSVARTADPTAARMAGAKVE